MNQLSELYPSLLISVIEAATEAANFIKSELNNVSSSDIEEKERYSFVSYVDKTAEKIIVDKLLSTGFAANFITEEDTVTPESSDTSFSWAIDPLDGTTNFLKKIPQFAVSIALEYEGFPVIGVVFDVMQNDCYSAIINEGAFLNGEKLQVQKELKLANAIVATGFPYSKEVDYDKKLALMKFFLENAQDLRRLGSAALDLVFVASGKLEIYYEQHLNRWDYSAGSLIATEAGVKVSDFSKNRNYLENGEIVACHPSVYEEVIEAINTHLT